MSTDLSNQYAPPKSNVADMGGADEDAALAGRRSRLGAKMLDGLIIMVGFIPAYMHLFKVGIPTTTLGIWSGLVGSGVAALIMGVWILLLLAVNLHFMRQNGQTIGKKLVGIKVVRTDGSRISLARYFFLRSLVSSVISAVPGVGRLYSLVDPLFIFGKPRRCIHDYIADTIVIGA